MAPRRKVPVVQAPLAITSDGTIIVNATHLATKASLEAVVRVARESGLPIFVGVAVPLHLRGSVLRDVDDALADVVGRIGQRLGRSGRPRS